MEKRNVTISLPRALLKKAKMLAASKDKSLSQFLRESLEEKVRETDGYNKARKRQLELLRKGVDLGTDGHIAITREEIHERR